MTQHESRPFKIIIYVQIGLEIALFSKLQPFKYIVLIKILLWCTILLNYGDILCFRCIQKVLRMKLYLPRQKQRMNETLILKKIVTVASNALIPMIFVIVFLISFSNVILGINFHFSVVGYSSVEFSNK